MSEAPKTEMLGNLKLNIFYKYFLYVFGVILILSNFWVSQGIESGLLRSVSINIIVISSVLWLFDKIFDNAIDFTVFYGEDRRMSERRAEEQATAIHVFRLIIYFIGLALIIFQLYGLV